MRMKALFGFIAGLAILSASFGAHASAIKASFEINANGVRQEISLSGAMFDQLFPLRRESRRWLRPDEERAALDLLARRLPEANLVSLDGIAVRPIVDSLEFIAKEEPRTSQTGGAESLPGIVGLPGLEGLPGFGAPPADKPEPESASESANAREGKPFAGGTFKAVLVHRAMEPPLVVSIVWNLYPPGEDRMYAGVSASGGWREILFTRQEPEHIWHSPDRRPPAGLTVSSEMPRKPGPRLPVPTVALLLAAFFLPLMTRRTSLGPRARYGASAVMFAAAVALVGVGRVELPFAWGEAVERPDEDAAKEIFSALHQNIYRAFDYQREEDVYDVLARSVDGPLLPSVYNEVYQSLIMRDQGGAVSEVDEVKAVETGMFDPPPAEGRPAAAFGVRHRWRVRGSVHHWGHTHTRTNEYHAEYVVEPRQGDVPSSIAWKITASQVLEQTRLADETDDPAASGGMAE